MNKEELLLEIIEKVHSNVQELSKEVNEVRIEQVRQGEIHIRNTVNVEEHVRRSNALEESIAILREEFKPIQTHVEIVKFCVKVVCWLIGSGGLLYLVKALM